MTQGEAVIKVLNMAGIEVSFPGEQTCCGAPVRCSGAFDVAANNAINNIKALDDPGVKYVVFVCPTCTVVLKHEFYNTLESEGKARWLSMAKELSAKAIDFSTLVTKLIKEGRLSLTEAKGLGKLTYHDSCHLKRTLNVSDEKIHVRENLEIVSQKGNISTKDYKVFPHHHAVLSKKDFSVVGGAPLRRYRLCV